MGCMCSSNQPPVDAKGDGEAMTNFLSGGKLDELWSQFDSNNDNFIDAKEFENLIYVSLKHFCQERNPDEPPPTQKSMKPFIKKLVEQLQPFVDKDEDMKITREEFEGYGTYLTTEFNKVQADLKADKNN